jgi:hypothetical protein
MPGNPFYKTDFWRDLRRRRLELDHHRCAVPGCTNRATFADHIKTRPFVPHPCEADRLDNLRSLCFRHDWQIKEKQRGQAGRKQGGRFKGVDINGWPVDPAPSQRGKGG